MPLKAFDNKEEAEAFAQEREKWVKGVPQNLMGFLYTLGIVGLGVTLNEVSSPSPERRISLVAPGMQVPSLLRR